MFYFPFFILLYIGTLPDFIILSNKRFRIVSPLNFVTHFQCHQTANSWEVRRFGSSKVKLHYVSASGQMLNGYSLSLFVPKSATSVYSYICVQLNFPTIGRIGWENACVRCTMKVLRTCGGSGLWTAKRFSGFSTLRASVNEIKPISEQTY